MKPTIGELRKLEGQRVCVALNDGSRLDDCCLVSAGRGQVETIWVFVNDIDAFLRPTDVVAVWEAAPAQRLSAA